MSISVLSGSPLVATPVYNKMLYKVSGSLIAQPNYRYVCDVKNPAGTTLARLKCDKLPTTNFGFFDVQRVVETLIAPTAPSLTQTGFVEHSGFYSGYRLDFTQEYGNTPRRHGSDHDGQRGDGLCGEPGAVGVGWVEPWDIL
jgi:hypothetical protein